MFIQSSTPHRSKRSASHHTQTLLNHERVRWAEQQVSKYREKRGAIKNNREEDNSSNSDTLFMTKRAQNLAYRETNYSDPQFNSQWYLVIIEMNEIIYKKQQKSQKISFVSSDQSIHLINLI